MARQHRHRVLAVSCCSKRTPPVHSFRCSALRCCTAAVAAAARQSPPHPAAAEALQTSVPTVWGPAPPLLQQRCAAPQRRSIRDRTRRQRLPESSSCSRGCAPTPAPRPAFRRAVLLSADTAICNISDRKIQCGYYWIKDRLFCISQYECREHSPFAWQNHREAQRGTEITERHRNRLSDYPSDRKRRPSHSIDSVRALNGPITCGSINRELPGNSV